YFHCRLSASSPLSFTTTIRALRGTFHQFREVCGFNTLTCCANEKNRTKRLYCSDMKKARKCEPENMVPTTGFELVT
ncbi:hypothetical protein ABUU04_15860, partial [Escherichia coli]